MAGMTFVKAENTALEYSKDGATYYELPYIGDISASGGEAPETDIIAFKRTGKLAGKVRVPTFTVAIPSLTPQLQAFKDIRAAAVDGSSLNWRLTTKEDEIFKTLSTNAGDTVAIAQTTGIVTFAGTKPDFSGSLFGEGMVINDGTDDHVIDSISEDATPVVKVRPAPAAALAATNPYTIKAPSLRLGPFTGKMRSGTGFELPAEGVLSGTLEITPEAQLPDWTIQ